MADLDTLLANPQDAAYVVESLREEALARSAANGLFWLRFVKTRDEADAESIKPFPRLPYIELLWREIDEHQKIVIAKSRQMLLSWLLCAYIVHFARFHAHKYVIWQTQKEQDANAMICLPGGEKSEGYTGRCQFIERHLPSWLRQRVGESEGRLLYPNGSMIEGLAGGANQVRGKTPSVLIEDEFAFQPEAGGVYQAVAPLIQKQTKFIAVSTPNGPTGMFSELYHGHSLAPAYAVS